MFVTWETILGRQPFILFYVYRFGIFTFRSVVLRWTNRGSSNILAFVEWAF